MQKVASCRLYNLFDHSAGPGSWYEIMSGSAEDYVLQGTRLNDELQKPHQQNGPTPRAPFTHVVLRDTVESMLDMLDMCSVPFGLMHFMLKVKQHSPCHLSGLIIAP